MADSLGRIEHFFVLMLENRSFDHMLGFSKIAGRDPAGNPASIDGLTGSEAVPIDPSSPDSPVVAASADADLAVRPDPPHEFTDVRTQLCGPNGRYPDVLNNGFIASYSRVSGAPERIMRCFSPARLPVLTALATEFAVCDAWHSAMPGPTWPNRFFIHAATSGGLDASPDADDTLGAEFLEGYTLNGGNTIYSALEGSGRSWRVYHGDPLPQVLALRGMHGKYLDSALEGWFRRWEDFKSDVRDPDFAPSYVFIEPDYGHDWTANASKDFLGGNSQHPVGNVADGEQLIKDLYEALRASPIWERSALVITYDEHGGFYDHVRPPTDAVPTGDDARYNQNGFDFKTLGVRVPAVVVSPWIPRNTVDHARREHASVLATVEKRFGLPPLNRRDAAASPFDGLFCLEQARDAPMTLPRVNRGGGEAVVQGPPGADMDPATKSFLHLAGSLDFRSSPGRSAGVQSRVKAIRSKEEAQDYIQGVAARLKAGGGSGARR